MQITIRSLKEIGAAAEAFLQATRGKKVFALYGSMGAGKTTFVRALCAALGTSDTATSPSFAIVNEYTIDATGESIYHFDFYRVKSLAEVCDMGCEEYLYSGAICLIEWPEIVEGLLPDDALSVTIAEGSNGERIVTF